ncbi:HemK2/MTQ2 family protein methyltransferase [Kibdelosporangium persicum]|uniref:Release factor glutamine methyltransferase n=1 Tax=Kibdelosporangium persicum TaxID=2698649 RepID=A0ABX2EW95_9PSEU|nr:HemK2/MTQ2 family protein methyltransferase [Kibdelosporangium persicum]NRN63149.1 Release factor glutamine methyltransferase [Kibdelosporangium persicum]
MWLLRPPGVYRPQEDTWLLADALRTAPLPARASVLDVCTGTGALAVTAGRLGAAEVTAIDVSRRAATAAWVNGRVNGVPIRALRGHFGDLVGRERFDVILANPPYVPARQVAPHGKARAWDAGDRGRAVLDPLCAVIPLLLNEDGMALIVHSELCGSDSTVHALRGSGLKASVIARQVVPFGPVMRSRTEWLVSQGLVEPGQDHEELVVIRADVPTR